MSAFTYDAWAEKSFKQSWLPSWGTDLVTDSCSNKWLVGGMMTWLDGSCIDWVDQSDVTTMQLDSGTTTGLLNTIL